MAQAENLLSEYTPNFVYYFFKEIFAAVTNLAACVSPAWLSNPWSAAGRRLELLP